MPQHVSACSLRIHAYDEMWYFRCQERRGGSKAALACVHAGTCTNAKQAMRAVEFALAVRVWAQPRLARPRLVEAAAAVQGEHVTSPACSAEPTEAEQLLCTPAGAARIGLLMHTALQRLRG